MLIIIIFSFTELWEQEKIQIKEDNVLSLNISYLSKKIGSTYEKESINNNSIALG